MIVLVTGATIGGIGAALSLAFAENGCKVYASSRKAPSLVHPNIENVSLDVTSDDDVSRVVENIVNMEGAIDILVNNAGVLGISPICDVAMSRVKEIFDTNTFAAIRLTQAVAPHMQRKRSGLIINMGSITGNVTSPWNATYAASKAALHSLTDALDMELRPFNIRVLLICAGSVRSNLSKNEAAVFSLPETSLYESYLPNILARLNASQSGKAMPADEFAKIVVKRALSSHAGGYIYLGGYSLLFELLRWFPRTLLLWILWRSQSKKIS